MRFLRHILLFFVFASTALAQNRTLPFVRFRIQDVARLISANPTRKLDTLFASSFLAAVPEEQLNGVFSRYYKSYGDVVGWHISDSSHADGATVRLVLSKGYTVDLQINVNDSAAHLITGCLLGLGTPQIKTLDALVSKFAKLPGKSGLFIAKITPDGLEQLEGLNVDTPMAIGSAFKLYVLGALEAEILSGKRQWEDIVYLDSGSRSLPSGMLHSWPVGTAVTLQTAATLMISISDNSATDLLIRTLGAETIERFAKTSESHNTRNVPFLTTLELFKLKSHAASLGQRYLTLGPSAQRTFLDTTVEKFPRDSVDFGAGNPLLIDKIEWFASARELANEFRWIRKSCEGSASSHKVLDILAINPGINFDRKKWKYVGYKGGSEPGVLNMSFLLERSDGTWYVLTAAWNNSAKAVDEESFAGLLERAAELIP